MRTRRSKKPVEIQLSFVEVKEEPNAEYPECSEVLQPQKKKSKPAAPPIVNKHYSTPQPTTTEQQSSKPYYRRSRATQVSSEDIDAISAKNLNISNFQAENKPIEPTGIESIVPQCRFCLRRVSREHLKIILSKHKRKALAAFQIRVYPNDAYPLSCTNCLSLMDIFLDFQSSVTKARDLLLSKRMHLESNGWDDVTCMDAFNQCKNVVERHRIELDAIYDEHMMNRVETRNESRLESKIEVHSAKQEVNSHNDFDHAQDTRDTDEMELEPIEPELPCKLESGFEVMDRMSMSQSYIDESIGSDSRLITTVNYEEIVDNKNYNTVKTTSHSVDEGVTQPCASRNRRKTKVIKYTESEQHVDDKDYDMPGYNSSDDDEYLPVTSKKSKSVSDSEQETNGEISISGKLNHDNKRKTQRSSKTKRKYEKRKNSKTQSSSFDKVDSSHVLCDLCGERMRLETIEGHKNQHLGIKPYTCSVDGCEATFHGRSNMSIHMRRWHPENGVPVRKCDICGKCIRGVPTVFNQHRKRHFMKEKSHVCPVCGKGFTLYKYLKQHSIIHTGLLPYECSYCGKKFNNKWSMKTHEKNIHEKIIQTSAGYDLDPVNNATSADTSYA